MENDKRLILNAIKSHLGMRSDAEFARFLGIKPQTLATWHARNTFDTDLLYSKCEWLDANFLLTGKGDLVKRMGNAKLIESPNFMNVPLVGQYAYAGYLTGYSDPTWMESLPTVPFLITGDQKPKGTYISFEVRGDSMEDGSADSILEGDLILCRFIAPHLYQHNTLHIKQWPFVLVHETEGVIVKQLVAHDTEANTVTVHSLNPEYPDQTYPLSEIAQVYNVVQILRKPRSR